MADQKVVADGPDDRKVTVTFREDGSYWIQFSDRRALVIEAAFITGDENHSITVAPKR